MNSKERVHASLNRKSLDRIPAWKWYYTETVQIMAKKFYTDVSPRLFELICRLRNMQHAMLDLLVNPGLTDRLLEKSCDFAVTLSREAVSRFNLDMLWTDSRHGY